MRTPPRAWSPSRIGAAMSIRSSFDWTWMSVIDSTSNANGSDIDWP